MLDSSHSVYFHTTVSESNSQTLPKQYINFSKTANLQISRGKNDGLVVTDHKRFFMDITYSLVFNTEEDCGKMKKTILTSDKSGEWENVEAVQFS